MPTPIKSVLVALGLITCSSSPLLYAAGSLSDQAPVRTSAVDGPSTAWPIEPQSRPVDRDLAPEDIPSIQVSPEQPPHSPAMMDLTTAPTSLWTRIRLGFGLPDVSSPLVREQEEWYATRPEYVKRTIARSARYLHYIVEEIQKRGMPTEIALLPIIESAYNPTAYSRAHASGIWQFIPSTGKLYGLEQNFWYDGRRDVMAATNAALDYLQKLYDMFGSWDLALASYNWGEGAVQRAIAKNQARGLPTDYQSLAMPNETRYYIPKLQAVKNIVANPGQYGIDLAEVPNQPYFASVTTSKHMDVKLAAKLADVPLEEFVSLNPGYSRPVIRAEGRQTLLLPADKADTFRANLENHNEPMVSWQAYALRSGETVDRIAARYGVSAAYLRQINGIDAHHRLAAGSMLLVPGNASPSARLPDMPAPTLKLAKPAKKSEKAVHVARKGGSAAPKAVRTAHTQKSAPSRNVARKASTTAKTASSGPRKIVLAQRSR